MKLIIQIPCLNERDQLGPTLADLPRSIPGVDEIEVLIIDDGSTDGTAEVAESLGVHHIVRFPRNRGLSAAHMAGLDAAMRLGADIVVNTDADNQYRGEDIPALIAPVLEGRADIVVGDRQTDTIAEFSATKKRLQKLGSSVVRRFSGTDVADSTSGFRAMNRKALTRLFVHNRFTYTLETIIQAGSLGLVIENVKITTNPKTRESRLFKGIPEYLRRNGMVILRAYGMYWPLRTFGYLSMLLLIFGMALGVRFLVHYVQDPSVSRHIQSLLVGVGAVVLAFITGLMALLGDLLATNRRLNEEVLQRVRRLDGAVSQLQNAQQGAGTIGVPGVYSTGAAPWTVELPAAATASPSAPSPSDEDRTGDAA